MSEFNYDVAVSFASEDRAFVDRYVQMLRRNGLRVFYDEWERADLWGRDLYQHLDRIYRLQAQYCVVVVSKHYVRKTWPRHELRSAQARAMESTAAYILPIRLDESDVPGLPPSVGYLDGHKLSINEITTLTLSKVGIRGRPLTAADVNSDEPEERVRALTAIGVRGSTEHLDVAINRMLADSIEEVRARAAWAIDNLNDPRACSALVRAIHDPSFSVRSAAGWALVHLGWEAVGAEMERICRVSNDNRAREMASLVLQHLVKTHPE